MGGPGPWKVILPSFFISSFLGSPRDFWFFSPSLVNPPPLSIHHRCLAQYASPETPPATERQFYHCCEGSMRVSEAAGCIQIASGSQALKFGSSKCETINETHAFRQDSINSFVSIKKDQPFDGCLPQTLFWATTAQKSKPICQPSIVHNPPDWVPLFYLSVN